MEKLDKNISERLIKNNWPLQKSIRTEGQWVIHLAVQHNYLFFSPSFTSLSIWDHRVPANQKNIVFVIIQIKGRLLGENVCQSTMRQS